jgi:uracil-DNA glycosylase family 4
MTRESLPPTKKDLTAWLQYFEDLRLGGFYRDRGGARSITGSATLVEKGPATGADYDSEMSDLKSQMAKSKTLAPPASRAANTAAPSRKSNLIVLPSAQAPSLFEEFESVPNDSLERIRADIGDCTRCRLSERRTNIVFGVGNPKAELVFIGEGPGHDEDVQGIPFVGRAGKLLTQMIEAMGVTRDDVYIANVVKCRPPENRQPEKDEVATCSPFLLRQLEVIRPKAIVCLGATAVRCLLGADKSISSIRGHWVDFRGVQLMATYHPAYLLRNPAAKGDVWKDLQKVMAFLGMKPRKAPAKN